MRLSEEVFYPKPNSTIVSSDTLFWFPKTDPPSFIGILRFISSDQVYRKTLRMSIFSQARFYYIGEEHVILVSQNPIDHTMVGSMFFRPPIHHITGLSLFLSSQTRFNHNVKGHLVFVSQTHPTIIHPYTTFNLLPSKSTMVRVDSCFLSTPIPPSIGIRYSCFPDPNLP